MTDFYVNDFYYESLGIQRGANEVEIRKAYRKKVRENHPDLFSDEDKKAFQKEKMILLNEAYRLALEASKNEIKKTETITVDDLLSSIKPFKASTPSDSTSIAKHKDESYVYYKQGFIHFSNAVNGIMRIKQRIKSVNKGDASSLKHFNDSLKYLQQAERYFNRVITDYKESIWYKDSMAKLKKIDRFYHLYKAIINNLEKVS